jgi:hypothetical protein
MRTFVRGSAKSKVSTGRYFPLDRLATIFRSLFSLTAFEHPQDLSSSSVENDENNESASDRRRWCRAGAEEVKEEASSSLLFMGASKS